MIPYYIISLISDVFLFGLFNKILTFLLHIFGLKLIYAQIQYALIASLQWIIHLRWIPFLRSKIISIVRSILGQDSMNAVSQYIMRIPILDFVLYYTAKPFVVDKLYDYIDDNYDISELFNNAEKTEYSEHTDYIVPKKLRFRFSDKDKIDKELSEKETRNLQKILRNVDEFSPIESFNE